MSSVLAPDFAIAQVGRYVVLWDPNGNLAAGPMGKAARQELSRKLTGMAFRALDEADYELLAMG